MGLFLLHFSAKLVLEAVYGIKQFDLFPVLCSWESCNLANVVMDMF
jgi:hypothetical protein